MYLLCPYCISFVASTFNIILFLRSSRVEISCYEELLLIDNSYRYVRFGSRPPPTPRIIYFYSIGLCCVFLVRAVTDLISNFRDKTEKLLLYSSTTLSQAFLPAKMVTTRSGKSTEDRRYPKCKRHPNGGVKCSACVYAGKTQKEVEEWEEYCRSKKIPFTRRSSGGKAPMKAIMGNGS